MQSDYIIVTAEVDDNVLKFNSKRIAEPMRKE